MLRSPSLERRWGKPELTVLADGSYMLRYFQDSTRFETLAVIGSPKTFPQAGKPEAYPQSYGGPPIRPSWQGPIPIAGKPVRFAQSSDISGADPLEFSTETFSLTAPDGRTASYRLIAETNLEAEGRQAASYLKTAGW